MIQLVFMLGKHEWSYDENLVDAVDGEEVSQNVEIPSLQCLGVRYPLLHHK